MRISPVGLQPPPLMKLDKVLKRSPSIFVSELRLYVERFIEKDNSGHPE